MSKAAAARASGWQLIEPAVSEARALSRELGLSLTAADLLLRAGHADPAAAKRFLEPRLAELTQPDHMVDREAACARLAAAVRAGERLCVFGDYDCDGITSAAIMTGALRALGGDVRSLLASRFDGGYGLSPAALERVVATGSTVLVTCDCGSSDHQSIAEARRRGIDVIVIDHHLVPDEPLCAVAFLNPHRPECGFPYKGMASCGLSLSIVAGVRKKLGVELDVRQWLDLVAIGTIGDVAPLDGDNRALVRAGLAKLREAQRPGIRALLEVAEMSRDLPLSAHDVAFGLAPRINAPGRLGAPDLALELLLSGSLEEARPLAARVEQLTTERRAIQRQMIAEAEAEIESEGWQERPALVIGREGWSHGIVGIVAGRLASSYHKPVIALGFEGGRGRGSVRGPQGARLYDLLETCRDVLVRFGGHQAAAGLELELSRLPELRERFESASAAGGGGAHAEAPSRPATLLASGDDPARVAADLARFEPCGEQNPAPTLGVRGRVLESREVRGGHLKLELELDGGFRIGAFGVAMGARASELSGAVTLIGQLRPDRYRGGGAVELRADAIV